MKHLFGQPLDAITGTQLQELCGCGCAEDQQLEFKGKPPRGKDRWTNPTALAEVAEEVVGFANTDGGLLLLGISEGGGHPACAETISPVEGCIEQADRIDRALAGIIDPYPAGLKVRPILMDSDRGVIAIRVPPSLDAPHAVRDGKRLHVTVRRGEQTVTCAMRDVQLLTQETRRLDEAMERRISSCRERFRQWDFSLGTPLEAGYRVTVTPARRPFDLRDLGACRDASFRSLDATLEFESGRLGCASPRSWWGGGRQRRVLRGVQSLATNDGLCAVTVLENGTVDAQYLPSDRPALISGSYILGDLLGAIRIACLLRDSAGAGLAELVADVELARVDGKADWERSGVRLLQETTSMRVAPELNQRLREINACDVPLPVRFPRYALSDQEEISRVAADFWRDLRSVCGVEPGHEVVAVRFPE